MLEGAGRDDYLSLVTYWSIGQGISVLLRQWIEEFIRDLVLYQRDHFGRGIQSVYTLPDLKKSRYLNEADQVSLAGEDRTEHSLRGTWNVPIRRPIVSAANTIADCLLRAYQKRMFRWEEDAAVIRRGYGEESEEADSTDKLIEDYPVEDTRFQRDWLMREALRPEEGPVQKERLICNLLVIEKPPGKVRAFRFAAPSMGGLRALREEKRNLLLLYGWLRQEKPFRVYRDSVETYWTYLLPRGAAFTQQFFFAPSETMQHNDFWAYLGVPYWVLMESLAEAGEVLRNEIGKVIRKASARSIRRAFEKKSPPQRG
jgi:hypothetical protein